MSQGTMTTPRWTEITDVESLTALLGEAAPPTRYKIRHCLTDVDVAWLRASPLCVIRGRGDTQRINGRAYYGLSCADNNYRETVD